MWNRRYKCHVPYLQYCHVCTVAMAITWLGSWSQEAKLLLRCPRLFSDRYLFHSIGLLFSSKHMTTSKMSLNSCFDQKTMSMITEPHFFDCSVAVDSMSPHPPLSAHSRIAVAQNKIQTLHLCRYPRNSTHLRSQHAYSQRFYTTCNM